MKNEDAQEGAKAGHAKKAEGSGAAGNAGAGGTDAGTGRFSVRGGIFVGKVKSAKAPLTVTVEKKIVKYVAKFERYKKDRARIKAHNPPWINAKEGDIVKCGETRKISKTKSFVVLEIIRKGESK